MSRDHVASVRLESTPNVAEQSRACETLDLLARLQIVLTRTDLNCSCHELISGALDRFSDLEVRRLSRRALARARDRKDRIAAILTLLSDLNQLTENEKDRTVFLEMALLFDEISHSAAAAAAALRDIDETNVSVVRDECRISSVQSGGSA